jgi:hypothetical protein
LGRKEEIKEEASTDGDGTKENLGECPAGRQAGTTSDEERSGGGGKGRIQQETRVVVVLCMYI